jgi:homoserine O-acetyltransferase
MSSRTAQVFPSTALIAGERTCAAAPISRRNEGDFIIRNYAFRSGETLPELKLHYRALGTPKRDAAATRSRRCC